VSDYLWDKSGEPDPDVVELEKKLGPLGYRPRPLEMARFRRRRRALFVVSSVVAVAAAVALFVSLQRSSAPPAAPAVGPASPSPPLASFAVRRLEGSPAIGARAIVAEARLQVGGWLETDEVSRAQIQVADIGAVQVEPRSRVRLVGTGPEEHRLELARGRIAAVVMAPPRLFVVDTPAATAVDLGCAYTLAVADDGSGRLEVTSGQVMLEGHGRTSKVPAGAVAETRPGFGPGTPYVADAPEELRRALARVDFEKGGVADVRVVAQAARPHDVVTLEHLAERLEGEERDLIRERLCTFTECP
jgi:hypothetical protein